MRLNYICTLSMLLIAFLVNAQDISGNVTYSIKPISELEIDSTRGNIALQKALINSSKKTFLKTYNLEFNNHETLYTENVSLDKPTTTSSDIKTYSRKTTPYDKIYKDFSNNTFVAQNELYGKVFIINDSIKTIRWSLENETKTILGYKVYKATTIVTLKSSKRYSFNTLKKDIDDKDNELSKEPEFKKVVITAWYTMEIPVNSGPEDYHGLPGIILKINDGKRILTASEIEIDDNYDESIKIPKSGKIVTLAEYKKIKADKKKDLKKNYFNRIKQ